MRYKLLVNPHTGLVDENVVLRLGDNVFIPVNEDNLDYQRYLAWLAEGNEPEPAE